MCIWIDKGERPHVAERAITVYKILTMDNESPYYTDYVYYPGLNYPKSPVPDSHDMAERIGPGYLFAFTSLARAEQKLETIRTPGYFYFAKKVEFKIVEMEVPAGTKYYQDTWGEIGARALEWKTDRDGIGSPAYL